MTDDEETTAGISVHEFALICKGADSEIESEFSGIFSRKRTWKKAEDYIATLSAPSIPVKSAWGLAEYSGYDNPGAKGPRYYEWAIIEIIPENHCLLLRRPPEEERKRLRESVETTRAIPEENSGPGITAGPCKTGGKTTGDRIKDEMMTFCLCYTPPGSTIAPALQNLVP